MSKDLIVNVDVEGVEIALLDNKKLIELHHEPANSNFTVGDIFVGKVKKIVHGLNAAFVDIGFEQDAFLHYTDLGPQVQSFKKYIKQALKKQDGQADQQLVREPDIVKTGKIDEVLVRRDILLVQILKEPISNKGPRLTCEITLAGRYVVLAPFGRAISISRKIKQTDERARLKELAESLLPKNCGLIVRTAAEGKKVADIHQDIITLINRWKQISQEVVAKKPPCKVLSEVNKTSSIVRDLFNKSFSQVIVNDKNIANNLKSYIRTIAPESEGVVQTYHGRTPIFDYYGVTRQIKASFGKTVNISGGAYLVIEHTEALHVVDVNSGHRIGSKANQSNHALAINLEAASEVARQMRLRDLGGIVIIDFIDMRDPEHKKILFRRMKEAMEIDRARHTILPLSKFGLMQITRQRVRPELNIATNEVCPSCKGSGKVKPTVLIIEEITNNLSYLLQEMAHSRLRLVVHPFVEAYIKKGIISLQWKWFWSHKKWVAVESNEDYFLTEYHFYDAEEEELKM